MPIDTLKAAKRLQEEDAFTPTQAERIAEILSEINSQVITKDDLSKALSDLRADLYRTIRTLKDDLLEDIQGNSQEVENVRREVQEVRSEVRTEAQEVRTEIQQTKTSIIRWILGSIGALAAALSIIEYFLQ